MSLVKLAWPIVEQIGRWSSELALHKETGGFMLGSYDKHGSPIVSAAFPPGPRARSSAAGFADDIDYVEDNCQWVKTHMGLDMIGSWHVHPGNMNQSSSIDEQQAWKFVRAASLPSYVGIILNLIPTAKSAQKHDGSPRRLPGRQLKSKPAGLNGTPLPAAGIPSLPRLEPGQFESDSLPLVRVSVYVYEAAKERFEACHLRVTNFCLQEQLLAAAQIKDRFRRTPPYPREKINFTNTTQTTVHIPPSFTEDFDHLVSIPEPVVQSHDHCVALTGTIPDQGEFRLDFTTIQSTYFLKQFIVIPQCGQAKIFTKKLLPSANVDITYLCAYRLAREYFLQENGHE